MKVFFDGLAKEYNDALAYYEQGANLLDSEKKALNARFQAD